MNGPLAKNGSLAKRRAAPKSSLSGYVPPSSVHAEQSVIGAMLIQRDAIDRAAETVTVFDFYRDAHQHIFTSLLDMAAAGQPCDFVTVQEWMRSRDLLDVIGGPGYLASLMDTVPTTAHLEYYARIVRDKARLRRLIEASLESIGLALGEVDDTDAVLDRAASLISDAAEPGRAAGHSVPLSEVMQAVWDSAEANAELGGGMTGLPTGYAEFDRMTSGLQKTDLVILAARPSMGKTGFALNIAERNALNPERTGVTLVFSLEMSKEQLVTRVLSTGAMVQSQVVRSGRWDTEQSHRLTDYTRRSYLARIRIDDRTGLTPQALAREARRVQRTEGLDMIVVDYLQLMEPDRHANNRTQDVDSVIKALKNIGREFKVPVVVLSQLSRAVETRPNKRPMLSDLRESGGIEAEADLVCFLYRQAYYDQKEQFGEGTDTAGLPTVEETELIVAKHRNGPTGMVKLGFCPQFASFQDWQDDGF